MGTGDGGQQPLKVDPELLDRYGNQLLAAANDLPSAPPPFVVTGTDAISAAIADKLPAMEGEFQEQLPQLQASATQTASTIVSAAEKYLSTDQQLAADYEKHQFDRTGGSGSGTTGSGVGGSTSGAGSMSQMLSMPMQMASQLAQMPMQAMQGLSSVPQGIMQGVQQIGQLAGGTGTSEGDVADDEAKQDPRHSAAARDADAERAPDPSPRDAPTTTPVPQQTSPRHAAPDPELDA